MLPFCTLGKGKPIFLIPGVQGGSCYTFSALVKCLGVSQPVYAINHYGCIKGEEPLTTVEAMAHYTVALIKSLCPEPPYYLIGHSLGGLVAFEMAKILEAGYPEREARS